MLDIKYFEDETLSLKAYFVREKTDKKAIGGCRVLGYDSAKDALEDAKRLARNMSLKYKVVNLPYSGFKVVVYSICNEKRKKSFEKIGEWLNSYNGECFLATDTGSTHDDMVAINKQSDYVIDLPEKTGGFGSFLPLLTEGVVSSLIAAVEFKYRHRDYRKLSAYVLGLGHSGLSIAKELLKHGFHVSGYDNSDKKNEFASKCGISIVPDFLGRSYNLFVPCGAGYVVCKEDIDEFECDIIGGSANHPLTENVEEILHQNGVVVIPDFVISAGTIIIDDLVLAKQGVSMETGLKRIPIISEFVKEILEYKDSSQSPRSCAIELLDIRHE